MFCRGILHERCAPAVNSGDPLGANVKQYYIDSAIRKDNSQGQADMAAPAYNDESCRFWHGSIRYSPFSPLHFHFNHNQSLSNPSKPALADAGIENATDGELSTHCASSCSAITMSGFPNVAKDRITCTCTSFTAIAARNDVSEPIMALDWRHSVEGR